MYVCVGEYGTGTMSIFSLCHDNAFSCNLDISGHAEYSCKECYCVYAVSLSLSPPLSLSLSLSPSLSPFLCTTVSLMKFSFITVQYMV